MKLITTAEMDNINKICDENFYDDDKSVFIMRGDKCNFIKILDTFDTDYASITAIPEILLSDKKSPIEDYMEDYMENINVKLLYSNYFYIHIPKLDTLEPAKIKELVSGETFGLAESLLNIPDRCIRRKLVIFVYSDNQTFKDAGMNRRCKYL